MDARISVEERADGCEIAVTGELDISTGAELERTARRVQQERGCAMLVDLTAVEFIDSVGLGILIGVKRRGERLEVPYAIVAAAGGPVLRALEASGLDDALKVFTDRAAALASLS